MLKERIMDWYFDKGNKNISIYNFKKLRKRSFEEYGNETDINTKRKWGITTNGAEKGNPNHSYFDWYLDLGHIQINYTDYNFNHKYR